MKIFNILKGMIDLSLKFRGISTHVLDIQTEGNTLLNQCLKGI